MKKAILIGSCSLNVVLAASTIVLACLLTDANKKPNFDKAKEAVFEIHVSDDNSKKNGTCFAVRNDLFVTNAHVVGNTYKNITIGDKRRNVSNAGELLFKDDKLDIAVCRCSSITDFEPLKITTNYTSPGSKCYSLGNAGNNGIALYEGIISDTSFKYTNNNVEQTYIESNIKSYQGVSGGPLFNKYGECIGMNTFSMYVNGDSSEGVVEEFGYAIRGETILKILESI